MSEADIAKAAAELSAVSGVSYTAAFRAMGIVQERGQLVRERDEARAEVERLQEQLRGLVARWQRIIRPDGEDQALAALTWQVEAVLDHRNV